jgi:hypothetical protein
MKYHPSFFSLSKKQQDVYKITNENEIRYPFKKFLFKKLMDIIPPNTDKGDKEAEEEFLNQIEVPDDILLKMNSAQTYMRGIGENYFTLNESFDDENGENILSFKTLYDYDLSVHDFQEKCMIGDGDDEPAPYLMRLSSRWARLHLHTTNKNVLKSEFYYLILTSISIHIYDILEDKLLEYIDTLIPNEFVDGENNGKMVTGKNNPKNDDSLVYWDFKIDANGLEDVLEDLNTVARKFLNMTYDRLKLSFNENKRSTIWVSDESSENDPYKLYIFSDMDVLKNINLDNFQEDTEKFITEDMSFIKDVITKEEELLFRHIDTNFKDLMDKFDPKIKRLKKPSTIIVNKGFNIDEFE